MQVTKILFGFGVSSVGLMGAVVGLVGAQCVVLTPPVHAIPSFVEPAIVAAQAASLSPRAAIASTLDDYQPPDVGGPGQTKGAGTR